MPQKGWPILGDGESGTDNQLMMPNRRGFLKWSTAAILTGAGLSEVPTPLAAAGSEGAGGERFILGTTRPASLFQYNGEEFAKIGAELTNGDGSVVDIIEFEDTLYASTTTHPAQGRGEGAVYEYTGDSWEQVGNSLFNEVTSLAIYDGDLYAGTSYGESILYRLDSDGTWTEVFRDQYLDGISALIVWEDKLFIGDALHDIFGYFDGEEYHQEADQGGSCVFAIESHDGDLFAGAEYGYIYKRNGGEWTRIREPDGFDGAIYELESHNGTLYAGSQDNNLYRFDVENNTFNSVHEFEDSIVALKSGSEGLYVGLGQNAAEYEGGYREEGTSTLYRWSSGDVEQMSDPNAFGSAAQVIHLQRTPSIIDVSYPGTAVEVDESPTFSITLDPASVPRSDISVDAPITVTRRGEEVMSLDAEVSKTQRGDFVEISAQAPAATDDSIASEVNLPQGIGYTFSISVDVGGVGFGEYVAQTYAFKKVTPADILLLTFKDGENIGPKRTELRNRVYALNQLWASGLGTMGEWGIDLSIPSHNASHSPNVVNGRLELPYTAEEYAERAYEDDNFLDEDSEYSYIGENDDYEDEWDNFDDKSEMEDGSDKSSLEITESNPESFPRPDGANTRYRLIVDQPDQSETSTELVYEFGKELINVYVEWHAVNSNQADISLYSDNDGNWEEVDLNSETYGQTELNGDTWAHNTSTSRPIGDVQRIKIEIPPSSDSLQIGNIRFRKHAHRDHVMMRHAVSLAHEDDAISLSEPSEYDVDSHTIVAAHPPNARNSDKGQNETAPIQGSGRGGFQIGYDLKNVEKDIHVIVVPDNGDAWVHEFGHRFDLPDLYSSLRDPDEDGVKFETIIGPWGAMGGGEIYCGYARAFHQDWLTPTRTDLIGESNADLNIGHLTYKESGDDLQYVKSKIEETYVSFQNGNINYDDASSITNYFVIEGRKNETSVYPHPEEDGKLDRSADRRHGIAVYWTDDIDPISHDDMQTALAQYLTPTNNLDMHVEDEERSPVTLSTKRTKTSYVPNWREDVTSYYHPTSSTEFDLTSPDFEGSGSSVVNVKNPANPVIDNTNSDSSLTIVVEVAEKFINSVADLSLSVDVDPLPRLDLIGENPDGKQVGTDLQTGEPVNQIEGAVVNTTPSQTYITVPGGQSIEVSVSADRLRSELLERGIEPPEQIEYRRVTIVESDPHVTDEGPVTRIEGRTKQEVFDSLGAGASPPILKTPDIELKPPHINKRSKGEFVTVKLGFTDAAASRVSLESVSFNGVQAITDERYGFVKNPPIQTRKEREYLTVKFPRGEVIDSLTDGSNTASVTGVVGGTTFAGTTEVELKNRGGQTNNNGHKNKPGGRKDKGNSNE